MDSSTRNEAILNKLFNEWTVLKKIPSEEINLLINGLIQMRDFGVNSFAVRLIDKKGYSAMFCTNVLWPPLIGDNNFYIDFKNHISTELSQLYKNKSNIISRAGDKIHSPFLEKLEQSGQNNSIIINNFYNDRIEVIYFMADPNFPENRDKILNNLEQLKFIKKSFDPILRKIINSNEFKKKKTLLLTPSSIDFIWKRDFKEDKQINIFLGEEQFLFSIRELECLSLLRFGASNIFIAETLGVSVETVKSYLLRIKYKLNTTSRKRLIEMSKLEAFISIFNILNKR
jgi:DNA-binding CsgD family transcriptional regulator